jgi:hypothetical protein
VRGHVSSRIHIGSTRSHEVTTANMFAYVVTGLISSDPTYRVSDTTSSSPGRGRGLVPTPTCGEAFPTHSGRTLSGVPVQLTSTVPSALALRFSHPFHLNLTQGRTLGREVHCLEPSSLEAVESVGHMDLDAVESARLHLVGVLPGCNVTLDYLDVHDRRL